jgi:hypothetical protein
MVVSLAFLSGTSGCHRPAFLAGAVVRQSVPWPGNPGWSGQWVFAGLDAGVPPRIRPGSYATATREVRFLDAANLGRHGYRFDWSEQNGIIYTCRAGHIDIAHVRKAADYAGYLAAVALGQIEQGRTQFWFKLIEPSRYFITLTFPPDWSHLDGIEQERIARIVSRDLGAHLAHVALTWHEIITWFGYRPRPHKSEFPSAFSWEDTYSNALGAQIGAAALANPNLSFDEAVTGILARWICELDGQPAHVARQASEAMRGQWYTKSWIATRISRRNFDVGLDDGHITPCLVPSVTACEGTRPQPVAAPTLDSLARHGFSVTVELEPRLWEQNKISKVLNDAGSATTKRLDPAIHFPLIIAYCEADHRSKGN